MKCHKKTLPGNKINDFTLVRIQKKVILPKPVLQVFGTVFKMSNA